MRYSLKAILIGIAIVAIMLAVALNASAFLYKTTRTGVLLVHLIAVVVTFRTYRNHDLRAPAFLAGSWVFLAYYYIVCRLDEHGLSLATTQLQYYLWQAIRVENSWDIHTSSSTPQYLPEWAYFCDICTLLLSVQIGLLISMAVPSSRDRPD